MKVLIKYDNSWFKELDSKSRLGPYVWTGTRDKARVFDSDDYSFANFLDELLADNFNPLTIERA